MDLITIKNAFCGAVGVVFGAVVGLLGGWDKALEALVVCMIIDFVSGFIVASVFHKSPKTQTGGTASEVSREGISRKCMMLLFVMIGYELERITGSAFIRESIIYGFIVNELLSITENAALMNLPIPKVILDSLDVIKDKSQNVKNRKS